jgi:hypothetical protein
MSFRSRSFTGRLLTYDRMGRIEQVLFEYVVCFSGPLLRPHLFCSLSWDHFAARRLMKRSFS